MLAAECRRTRAGASRWHLCIFAARPDAGPARPDPGHTREVKSIKAPRIRFFRFSCPANRRAIIYGAGKRLARLECVPHGAHAQPTIQPESILPCVCARACVDGNQTRMRNVEMRKKTTATHMRCANFDGPPGRACGIFHMCCRYIRTTNGLTCMQVSVRVRKHVYLPGSCPENPNQSRRRRPAGAADTRKMITY